MDWFEAWRRERTRRDKLERRLTGISRTATLADPLIKRGPVPVREDHVWVEEALAEDKAYWEDREERRAAHAGGRSGYYKKGGAA